MINATDESFVKDVLEASLDKYIVVDFWADWCQPCKMVGPVLEEIEKDNSDVLSLVKIDVDKNPTVAKNYSVKSVPTILVIKNGEVLGGIVGARPKFAMNKAIMTLVEP
jgi:thioredoxin 1